MVPDTDENRSAWVSESRPPVPAPKLAAKISTDVAIVGGGLTGVSTAWHLRQRLPDLGVVLLEGGILGQGASGRNGGQVLNWVNGVDPKTPEATQRTHAATRAGIDLAEQLARKFAPESFERQGCLEVYTDVRRAQRAAARVERLRAAGIPLEFLPGSALGVQGAHGAVLDPQAGRLNGFALLQGMRPALLAEGVVVHEHTPVRRVQGDARIVLETPEGEVRARALVLATNAYTPALGFFRNGILPLHSHVLATAPVSDDAWLHAGWGPFGGFTDDRDRIAYACRTPGGRVIFGGGGNPAYVYRFGGSLVGPPGVARAGRFMRARLTRYFPRLGDVPIERQWTGILGITLDRICSMGVGGPHANVYHALGYSGHGLALALLAGRVLADLYQGNHEAWREQPFYQKKLLPIPPEPLRWLGYQAYTRLTGRSPRRQG
jgi:glycine/D-amino acid oxidase-like deaminating enzyme